MVKKWINVLGMLMVLSALLTACSEETLEEDEQDTEIEQNQDDLIEDDLME